MRTTPSHHPLEGYPQPVISETKVGEQDLSIPPSEVAVEEPSKPSFRQGTPEKGMVIPPARAGDAEQAIEPSQPTGSVIAGISPFLFDPELPPEPTMRRGPSEEVAIPEPEPIEEPVKKEVMPPGQPAGFETPAEEKRIEVAKVQPGAPVIPIKTLGDVYFDYDRYSLREDAQDKLNDNAQLLVDQLSGQKVVIEGHCDERGTQGYNMILGKRRAESVKKFLVDLGVPEENIEVITYGKERPFCTDHSMECWQENRRGHFVLR